GANTCAIGAKVKAIGAALPQQQEMVSGGRYLSCDDAVRMFACGAQPMSVEVCWPNATRSIFSNLTANCVYEFAQPTNASPAELQKPPPAFFVDVSSRLNHHHVDPAFDDFQRQPFLPYSLSTQGPALA